MDARLMGEIDQREHGGIRPNPQASDNTAMIVKVGDWVSERRAKRTL